MASGFQIEGWVEEQVPEPEEAWYTSLKAEPGKEAYMARNLGLWDASAMTTKLQKYKNIKVRQTPSGNGFMNFDVIAMYKEESEDE